MLNKNVSFHCQLPWNQY